MITTITKSSTTYQLITSGSESEIVEYMKDVRATKAFDYAECYDAFLGDICSVEYYIKEENLAEFISHLTMLRTISLYNKRVDKKMKLLISDERKNTISIFMIVPLVDMHDFLEFCADNEIEKMAFFQTCSYNTEYTRVTYYFTIRKSEFIVLMNLLNEYATIEIV